MANIQRPNTELLNSSCASPTTSIASRNDPDNPVPPSGRARPSTAAPRYFVCEPVTRYAAPRAISIMPRVTINGGTVRPTMSAPFARPATSPTATASAAHAAKGQCQSTNATPSTAPASASTEPMDKSIPPTMSTSVMPVAARASVGMRFAMAPNVAVVRNRPLNAPNNSTSATRITASARYSRIQEGVCFMLQTQRPGYRVIKSTTVVWSAGGASPLRIFSAASMPNTAS